MKYAVSNDQRIEATPKAVGKCPCCGADLIARCGDLKVWHWAHKGRRVCDHWWESETEWHRAWKDTFPKEWQEVTGPASDNTAELSLLEYETNFIDDDSSTDMISRLSCQIILTKKHNGIEVYVP